MLTLAQRACIYETFVHVCCAVLGLDAGLLLLLLLLRRSVAAAAAVSGLFCVCVPSLTVRTFVARLHFRETRSSAATQARARSLAARVARSTLNAQPFTFSHTQAASQFDAELRAGKPRLCGITKTCARLFTFIFSRAR